MTNLGLGSLLCGGEMIRYVIFALIGPLVGGFISRVGTPAGYWDKPYSDDLARLFKGSFSTLQYELPVRADPRADDRGGR